MANKTEMLEAAKFAYKEGLLWGNTGAISIRHGKNRCYVTKPGASYRERLENSIGCYDRIRKKWWGAQPVPAEASLLCQAYGADPNIKAAMICSTPYASLLMCCGLRPDPALMVNSQYEMHAAFVETEGADSEQLLEDLAEACAEAEIVFLKNTGVLVTGSSLQSVIDKAMFVEFLAKVQMMRCQVTRISPQTEVWGSAKKTASAEKTEPVPENSEDPQPVKMVKMMENAMKTAMAEEEAGSFSDEETDGEETEEETAESEENEEEAEKTSGSRLEKRGRSRKKR